jgi:MFS family permease
VPLLTAIRGDYFGRENFATILGFSQLPMNVVMMAAPIAAGFFYDTLGSYTVPFVGLAALNALGATLILLARKPVPKATLRQQEGEQGSPR